MIIRENYITDTCVADFKDMDGDILKMISNIDNTFECGDGDKSVKVIIDEEDEDSAAILEESQYDLIISRRI